MNEIFDRSNYVGVAAIKWGAIVAIVIAVLYFLAKYVIPLIS
ncbi:MAG: hypothetical protein PHV61_03420 [Limnochordia bacterium]|nr:hypothetical protein [Limnochordia bacterium]MDD4517633.1 hypothetical protein [Limnochordia bacterium]